MTRRRPRAALRSLHVYVHKLRGALGDAGLLERVGSGYRLAVAPGHLDAHVLRLWPHPAGELSPPGTRPGGAARLKSALALWRGPALAGLADTGAAMDETRRLDELRLQANEDALDAELALGRAVHDVSPAGEGGCRRAASTPPESRRSGEATDTTPAPDCVADVAARADRIPSDRSPRGGVERTLRCEIHALRTRRSPGAPPTREGPNAHRSLRRAMASAAVPWRGDVTRGHTPSPCRGCRRTGGRWAD